MAGKYTVAVGVDRYPHFAANKQLRYARRDATGFAEWAEAQGAFIHTLLSPNDDSATPVADDFADAVIAVRQELQADLADVLPPAAAQAKRDARLLLFFSGHGVAPDGNEILVLMANARPEALGRNVPLKTYIGALRRLGLWGEVWLFADCCREQQGVAPPGTPGINVGPPADIQVLTAQFYAVPHGDLAFEPTEPDPVAQHGVFSRCVLEGVWGAAAHPDTGQITAGSMRVWLQRRLRHASDGKQRLQATLDDPDLVLGEVAERLGTGAPASLDRLGAFVDAMLERLGTPSPGDAHTATLQQTVVAARTAALAAFDLSAGGNPFLPDDVSAAPDVAVRLAFPPGFSGEVCLVDGALNEVGKHTVVASEPWSLSLPEGLYEIEPFAPFRVRPGRSDVLLQAE